MMSEFLTVDSLWAIVMVVLLIASLSRVSWISLSFLLSRAEVASSSSRMVGFWRMDLAMDILCFWPPDS